MRPGDEGFDPQDLGFLQKVHFTMATEILSVFTHLLGIRAAGHNETRNRQRSLDDRPSPVSLPAFLFGRNRYSLSDIF